METTMAATPKARLATASAPSSRAPIDAYDAPASPAASHPPNTARMLPSFALPPPNDPNGPTRARELPPTRRTTVRVRRPGSFSDSLAGLASLVENAPLLELPDSAWTIIGRAWFFVAGTTMGILLALALIAVTVAKPPALREARTATTQGTARVLVVQRAVTAADRSVGALAENDLDEVAPPAPAPAPLVARRTAVVARRSAAAHRPSSGGKDILNAGL